MQEVGREREGIEIEREREREREEGGGVRGGNCTMNACGENVYG